MVTFISLIILRPVSLKINLIDYPNNRKKHAGNIPLIGGISIFIGVLASQIYLFQFNLISNLMLFASLLILLLGIYDDIHNLKARTKLYLQLTIVTIFVFLTQIQIDSLGNLFELSNSLDLGVLSIPFTIIAVVGLINAFNMIDGIDGQAAILATLAIFGIFFSNLDLIGLNFYNIILALFGGLIPFLIFNINSSNKIKVFLGDGGSLFIGFIIAMSLIYSSQNANVITPRFALWCVSIPLYDFFGVIVLRKIEKRSLFLANRDHIHHFLHSFGLSKTVVLLSISFAGISMLILGYFLENNCSSFSFLIFIILFLIYLIIRITFRAKNI